MFLTHLILALLGLSLGSFLGACAYRIPRRISIATVSSSCPSCGAWLSWSELIPVVSFALQRGRCRACEAKISWLYPVLEILVSAGTLIMFGVFGVTAEFVLKETFFVLMVLVSVIDWEFRLIPNRLIIAAAGIGITLKGLIATPELPAAISSAFMSSGVLLLIRLVADSILRQESLGMGDVKLAWVLGLFLGLKLFFVTFWGASILAAMFGLATGKGFRHTPLPFGSFLAVSSVLVFVFDQEILQMMLL